MAAKKYFLRSTAGSQTWGLFPIAVAADVSKAHGELIFPSLPYIAVYRLHKEAVEVLRIYHAAQGWP